MKSLRLTIMLATCTVAAYTSIAQKINWEQGADLAFLKGQQQLAVSYDYTGITVTGQPEADYVREQQDALNKDEAGKGDEFVKEWTEARTKKYQPNFEKQFNHEMKKSGLELLPEGDAAYTLIVVTNDMELGKGKTFSKKPAKINFTLLFVATADKNKVLARGTLLGVAGEVKPPKGSGWIPGGAGTAMSITANAQNRSYSNRLAESYEKTAGILAKHLKKQIR